MKRIACGLLAAALLAGTAAALEPISQPIATSGYTYYAIQADGTLLAWGPSVPLAMESAEAAAEEGTDLEVIDARSLSPVDFPTIIESVQRTGRLVIVHEAPVLGGLGGEIAARVTEQCFYHLEAPVLRVGGYHAPYPPARMEHAYLPDLDRVLDAVDRALEH